MVFASPISAKLSPTFIQCRPRNQRETTEPELHNNKF